MKKIINFFKKIFKLIISFFSEYVSSKSKVKKDDIKDEVHKIEKEVKYISVVGILPDDNRELSIYEERLHLFKKNNKLDADVKEVIEKTITLINKINNKAKLDNSLYDYIKTTTILLDQYYDDFNYFISIDKNDCLNDLHDKVTKVLKDYYKKEKEYEFEKADFDTKKIDKYGLLKNEDRITILISQIKLRKKSNKQENGEELEQKKEIKKDIIKDSKKDILIVQNDNLNINEDTKNRIIEVETVRKDDIEIKEEQKESIEIIKSPQKENKDNEKREEIKDSEKKEKLKEEIEEITKSIKLIDRYIESGERLAKSKKKKNLKTLANQTTRIGLSFFPMSLFKNKVIGALTSAVLLNNTIRSMRRGLHSEVDYIRLSKEDYITNDSMTTKTEAVRLDVLNQISLLKSEIRTEFIVSNDTELLTMYNDIERLELELKKKEEKQKAKIKIKTNKY